MALMGFDVFLPHCPLVGVSSRITAPLMNIALVITDSGMTLFVLCPSVGTDCLFTCLARDGYLEQDLQDTEREKERLISPRASQWGASDISGETILCGTEL